MSGEDPADRSPPTPTQPTRPGRTHPDQPTDDQPRTNTGHQPATTARTTFTHLAGGNIGVYRPATATNPECRYVVESIAQLRPYEASEYGRSANIQTRQPDPSTAPVFAVVHRQLPESEGGGTTVDAVTLPRSRVEGLPRALDERDDRRRQGRSSVPPFTRSHLSARNERSEDVSEARPEDGGVQGGQSNRERTPDPE